ncbi:hypothetical protein AC1031_010589 [Aphanomyces cochlioides]|nr:hypothetical protein AC1031_010589 [Aphanomyces cochlioides]
MEDYDLMRRPADSARERILEQRQLLPADRYMPLKSAAACLLCTKSFGMLRRACNCGLCGRVTCKKCSHMYIADVAAKILDVHVCLSCDIELDKAHKARANATTIAATNFTTAAAAGTPKPSSALVSRRGTPTVPFTSQPSFTSSESMSMPATSSKIVHVSTPYHYALDFYWNHEWPKPPYIANDLERVRALHRCDVEANPHRDVMAATATFACQVLNAPIGAVSFIDEHKQTFAASQGLAQESIPRAISICAHTIALRQCMVVLDMQKDIRFQNNPLVKGAGVAFYAGAPIFSPRGKHVVGTVFVMDTTPRPSTDIHNLKLLAEVITEKLVQDSSAENSRASILSSSNESTTSTATTTTMHPTDRVLSSAELIDPSKWIPDSSRSTCHICTQKFSLLLRKKHCRLCGDIVCKNCAASLSLRDSHDVRVPVCLACLHGKTPQNNQPRNQNSNTSGHANGRRRTSSGPALTTDTIEDEELLTKKDDHVDDEYIPTLEPNQSFDLDMYNHATFTRENLARAAVAIVPLDAPVHDYTKVEVENMLLRLLSQSNDIQDQLDSQARAMSCRLRV